MVSGAPASNLAFTKISTFGVEEQRVNVLVDVTSPIERWRGWVTVTRESLSSRERAWSPDSEMNLIYLNGFHLLLFSLGEVF
jgi:hypothetical protein